MLRSAHTISETPTSQKDSLADTLKAPPVAEPTGEHFSTALAPSLEHANRPRVPIPSGEIISAHVATHPYPPLSESPQNGEIFTSESPEAEPPTVEPPPQALPNPAPKLRQPALNPTPMVVVMASEPLPEPPLLSAADAQPMNFASYIYMTGANLLPLTAIKTAGIEHGIFSTLLPVHSNTSPQVTVTQMVDFSSLGLQLSSRRT